MDRKSGDTSLWPRGPANELQTRTKRVLRSYTCQRWPRTCFHSVIELMKNEVEFIAQNGWFVSLSRQDEKPLFPAWIPQIWLLAEVRGASAGSVPVCVPPGSPQQPQVFCCMNVPMFPFFTPATANEVTAKGAHSV